MKREGTLTSVSANGITGIILDKLTNTNIEFIDATFPTRGISIGEDVTYLSVTASAGVTIAVGVKKPGQI